MPRARRAVGRGVLLAFLAMTPLPRCFDGPLEQSRAQFVAGSQTFGLPGSRGGGSRACGPRSAVRRREPVAAPLLTAAGDRVFATSRRSASIHQIGESTGPRSDDHDGFSRDMARSQLAQCVAMVRRRIVKIARRLLRLHA
jgi:hypothetical protein